MERSEIHPGIPWSWPERGKTIRADGEVLMETSWQDVVFFVGEVICFFFMLWGAVSTPTQ